MKRNILRVIAFVLFGIAIYSGYKFFNEIKPYIEGEQTYQSVANQFAVTDTTTAGDEAAPPQIVTLSPEQIAAGVPTPTLIPTPSPEQLDLRRLNRLIRVDFPGLRSVNEENVGWIFSEGTNINYPLMMGADNYYYLRHLFDRTENKLGSIFVDSRNKPGFVDDTTVIYGHNMSDKSMFATLENYKKQEYFDQHPSIYILTPEKTLRVDLFAGYLAKPADITSLNFTFDSIAAKHTFVEDAKKRSTFVSPVTVGDEDQLVSFVTCAYDFYDARYILQGKVVTLWEAGN